MPEFLACVAEAELGEPVGLLSVAVFPALTPARRAPIMPSVAAEIEFGNALYSAMVDDATWPALSVKTVPMQTSPVAQSKMSTLDRVEIAIGKAVPVPVGAGINSTISFVPSTTASYTAASVNVFDVCVTGTACNVRT